MTAENVNITIWWKMTQNSFCCRYLARFGGTNCCCVQGTRIMKIERSSPKRRYVLTIPHSVSSQRTINLARKCVCDTFVHLRSRSTCKSLYVTMVHSVTQNISSLLRWTYAALIEIKLKPPKSVYSSRVQTQTIIASPIMFLFVRHSWSFLFTVVQVITSRASPSSLIFNEQVFFFTS
jgi:hypothetical protein